MQISFFYQDLLLQAYCKLTSTNMTAYVQDAIVLLGDSITQFAASPDGLATKLTGAPGFDPCDAIWHITRWSILIRCS